ncbi:programmed cell death protein 7 [Condylostylus longicornis]|uniref:programmed cell death protein 7 n=1 Tax=Condylostylus longicornis TaxID=2530218 RepID=UPI00244E4276|nr:programmed cell death protein 7 [Condylostylus longicornis]
MSFCVNISTAKSDVKQIILTFGKLHHAYNYLKNIVEVISEEEFDELMRKFRVDENILSNLLTKCEDEEFQRSLNKKLCKRAKKRTKINLRHKVLRIKNKELHETMDESLNFSRKKINETINKENICKQIKNNLLALKRKILTAEKRIKQIEVKYVSIGEKNEINSKTRKVLKSWRKKLDEYNNEESTLKDALSFYSQSLEDQWHKTLFGNKQRNRKVTNFSEIRKFFGIRKIWDSYLVTTTDSRGSSIPFGWVFPPERPSELWAEYLRKDDSILEKI